MLQRLTIQNLALIDSLDLVLDQGFTCLTGETGAGKSILLDAVGLLLGSRGSVEMIRGGEDRALVEGLFEISVKILDQVTLFLEQAGIEFTGRELVISREINASGKSFARINGRMATIQMLKELGKFLVQQHGQHDTLTLLKKDEQLRLLDHFHAPVTTSLLAHYQSIYNEFQEISKALSDAERHQRERMQRLDFLRMQVAEIAAAKLRVGENDALRRRKGKLQYAERLRGLAENVYQILYEGAGNAAAVNGELFRLGREVEAALALDGDFSELKGYLETALVHLSEAAEFARNYRDKMNFDPTELGKIEDRLAALDKLFRKYGENEQEILSYRDQAMAEIHELEHLDERLAIWNGKKQTLQQQLAQAATALTEARRAAAGAFAKEIKSGLQNLLMPNIRLEVKFVAVPFHETGADAVEFFFSANQGEELRPLAKIASGGELSRFMLALSKVLAGSSPVDTMIFDEIDTGISGTAAQKVAATIVEISEYHQVLCVTHQAQMACMADEHLLVEKNAKKHRTYTDVRPLHGDGRVEGLASMLGGAQVTETTRQHARELLLRKRGR